MQNVTKIQMAKGVFYHKERFPSCMFSNSRKQSDNIRWSSDYTSNEPTKLSKDFSANHLKIPILTTYTKPLFPKFQKIIPVHSADTQDAVESNIHGRVPFVGVFLRKNESELIEQFEQFHKIGTLALLQRLPDSRGKMNLFVNGLHQIEAIRPASPENISKSISMVEYCIVKFHNVNTSSYFRALTAEVVRTIKDVTAISSEAETSFVKYLEGNVESFGDVEFLCDLGASITRSKAEELQHVMNEMDMEKRLMLTLRLLKMEIERIKCNEDILLKTARAVEETHKNFVLKERMKVIRQKLYNKDSTQSLVRAYEIRLSHKTVPPNVMTAIDAEISKLKMLNSSNLEFGNVKQYLDWLTALPWGQITHHKFNLDMTRRILDETHFGMEIVKERILEFLSLTHLQTSRKGKVICLEGTSGVGKTTIAGSIAKAINRPYYKIAVGGLVNASEMKGHHRVYAGALPGKIVQGLKNVQTENPIILIDEIDKYIHADQILPEIFDASQNHEFLDNYLNLPVDLSKVLFICTANCIGKLSDALVDHLEVIEVPAYSRDEKMMIMKQYLLPKLIRENGLDNGMELTQIFKEESLNSVLDAFHCDPGLRGICRKLDQILRHIAYRKVKGENDLIKMTETAFPTLEPSRYPQQQYSESVAGVVRIMNFNKKCKDLDLIEVKTSTGYSPFQLTGLLNQEARDTAEVAVTLARNFLNTIDTRNNFFISNSIHINIPGHFNRNQHDGSNIGIAITTALLSIALNEPVRSNILIIGSISLQGKALPIRLLDIGQLCSFVKYHGITQILLPDGNKNEVSRLGSMENIEFFFVKNLKEVFNVVFDKK